VPEVQERLWQRDASAEFVFAGYSWRPERGELTLNYRLDGLPMAERFLFPIKQDPSSDLPVHMRAAFDLLHWTAGISYWKAGCPQRVLFEGNAPDQWQADWLNRLYSRGLAEFAYRQDLPVSRLQVFSSSMVRPSSAPAVGLDDQLLVPMGGGKDSLVAWSRLNRMGRVAATVQVGQSALIAQVAQRTGSVHLQISRTMDSKLGDLNRAGAFNGHVPITAINSAVLIVMALLGGHGGAAFANERSADEPTRIRASGEAVNHQFSKSMEFELMLDEWIRRYIASDLRVFSLLRRDRELAICRAFAELEQFHDVFSSCNRNFHLDGPRTTRWCGNCPKCRFVFLGLAPFVLPEKLSAIFGADLLADSQQISGFGELLALTGDKPFECVGEINEARSAIKALSEQPSWRDHVVVQALASRLAGVEVAGLEELCQPVGPHLIPERLLV
jgi:hypothetical protein